MANKKLLDKVHCLHHRAVRLNLMRWDRAKCAPIVIGYTKVYKEWDITKIAYTIARPLIKASMLGLSD